VTQQHESVINHETWRDKLFNNSERENFTYWRRNGTARRYTGSFAARGDILP